MVNEGYIDPLLALIDSLKLNSGFKKEDIHLIILELSELSDESRYLVESQGINIEFVDSSSLGTFEFDQSLLNNPSKLTNQKKFLIYKLPYSERLCYLDADMICLNDITDIANFDNLSAGINIGREPPETVFNRPMFNSGLFIFEPSNKTYEKIQDFALDYNAQLDYGDQRLLNEFYYGDSDINVDLLSFEWNVIITMKNHHPKMWNFVVDNGVKFLHYTLCEPWKDTNFYDIKEIASNSIKKYKYRDEIKLWKKHYQNALDST
ncbi:glycosyltransferase [Halalkalicoccus subterraneus]|uniref:glycosyltransferase n=1 Tax=Halalkalicoccus subterraneus TaxID=2675002 RepID=UPI001B86CD98|nr:glycosyltransferase [Halalkalicoccus subterraneus]